MYTNSIWVIGPIAWDTVLYISKLPSSGSFLHAHTHQERAGGQAFNVASGLASAGLPVNLVGYVGNDQLGAKLKQAITTNRISLEFTQTFEFPSPHVTILVDDSGERTMIGMENNLLSELSIEFLPIKSGDIVVWPFWNDSFLDILKELQNKCIVIIGSNSLRSREKVAGNILVLSKNEIPRIDILKNLNKQFSRIYITDGVNGSEMLFGDIKLSTDSMEIHAKDTTGAGDAYLAGVVLGTFMKKSDQETLDLSTVWAGLTVAKKQSEPIDWSFVQSHLPLRLP